MTSAEYAHVVIDIVMALITLIGVIVTLWVFRQSAKKDAKEKHEENRKAIQTTLDNQKEILTKIQTEQEFLPQHWHTEFGSPPERALTAGGILRRPQDQ